MARSLLARLAIGRNPRRTAVHAVVLAIVCAIVFRFVIAPVRVTGKSMAPTCTDGSIGFIYRLAYLGDGPRRGDIVGVRMAGDHVMLLKRVVGLPGEEIGFRDGRATVDGDALDEPYVALPSDWNLPPVPVAGNEYYVVGDNRSMPERYHTKGRASRDRIVGRLIRRGRRRGE